MSVWQGFALLFVLLLLWKLFTASFMPGLLLMLASLGSLFLVGQVLHRAGLLPGWMMDWLALTDREALRKALETNSRPQPVIDADALLTRLRAGVIGQDEVLGEFARAMARRTRQNRRSRPLFTALLVGPTGTGKTELARQLARALFAEEGNGSNGSSLCRIDCGQIQAHGIGTLIGSPKGYVGSQSWGTLTTHLRDHPRSVILFDEIEKAGRTSGDDGDNPLLRLLLSLLDEGRVTEQSDGTVIDARQAVIILTSNACVDRLPSLLERHGHEPDKLARALRDLLAGNPFAPELLARFDLVTTLRPLGPNERSAVAIMQIARLAEGYGLRLGHVDAELVAAAVHRWQEGGDYGARDLVRWLESQLADDLVMASDQGLGGIRIDVLPQEDDDSAAGGRLHVSITAMDLPPESLSAGSSVLPPVWQRRS